MSAMIGECSGIDARWQLGFSAGFIESSERGTSFLDPKLQPSLGFLCFFSDGRCLSCRLGGQARDL